VNTRAAALETINAQIGSSKDDLAGFLATDAPLIAKTLQPYRYAGEVVKELRDAEDDPAVRRKLNEVLGALE
jgi:hypothetical protein